MKDSQKQYLYSLATDTNQDLFGNILKIFLLLASIIYWSLVTVTLACYRFKILPTFHLGKKVISIGNITLGGVGKTPLVQLVAEFLKEKGLKPAVLTRGYMGTVSGQEEKKQNLSDEALLLERSLPAVPVIVGADRVASAKKAVRDHGADILILDDGFQQWRVHKDIEIVVIDTKNPFGNGCLLPRGILREPLNSLKRGHIFVLTKTDMKPENIAFIQQKLKSVNPAALIVEAVHEPRCFIDLTDNSQNRNLSFLRGKEVCSFCSIGDPESFEYTLKKLGCNIVKSFSFLDHHHYTLEDIRNIAYYCHGHKIDAIVTTQKDEVKLGRYINEFKLGLSLFSLIVEMRIVKAEDLFFDRIAKAAA